MERYNRKAKTFVCLATFITLIANVSAADEGKTDENYLPQVPEEEKLEKWERPKMCWDVRINNEDNFCYGATNWKLAEDVYYTSDERDLSKCGNG